MMKHSTLFLLPIVFLSASCSLLGNGSKENDESPRTIVFAGRDDGTFQIFSMREDGSGVRQLTNNEFGATSPAWSPDGNRIAYARSFGSTGGPELWVMNADGTNKQPLVDNPRTGNPQFGNHPVWSPDGTKIAFDHCLNCEVGGRNFDIFIADLQSGTIDTLTNHLTADTYPTWSPDGSSIAFASYRDYINAEEQRFRTDLYVVNIKSANLQRLTKTGNATRPAWSPEEIRIAYEWNIQGNEQYVYDLSNNLITNIETGLKFAGGGVWNNDGTELLVSGRKTDNAEPEIRFLDIIKFPPEILETVNLNENSIGRDIDWKGE